MEFTLLAHPLAITGEAPLWDPDRGCLWWLDIQAQRLLRTAPDGATKVIPLPWQPGLVALAASGRLVLGLEDELWAFDPEAMAWERIADIEADRPSVRLNDGKPDPSGRLWFGSMDMSHTGQRTGRLLRRETDGRITVVRDGIGVPNAIAPTADGTAIWFADTATRELERLLLDPATGEVASVECVVPFPESQHPDGACEDADGRLWIAVVGSGELLCLERSGAVVARHALPVTRPTMPILGGPTGRTLFLTCQRRFLDPAALAAQPWAGGLLVAQSPARAGPVHRVAGV